MLAERTKIYDFIVDDLLLQRLELKDEGYSRESFSEDTLIMADEGLALDSVDVLDLLVGVERQYKFKPIAIDTAYMEEHCASVATLVDMIIKKIQEDSK